MPIIAIMPQLVDDGSRGSIIVMAGGNTATAGWIAAALGSTDAITAPDVAGKAARLAERVGADVVSAPVDFTRVEFAAGLAVVAERITGKP